VGFPLYLQGFSVFFHPNFGFRYLSKLRYFSTRLILYQTCRKNALTDHLQPGPAYLFLEKEENLLLPSAAIFSSILPIKGKVGFSVSLFFQFFPKEGAFSLNL